jgi:hypothetical protein
MQRILAILLALTLAGCATYDSYGYRDDGYYDDRYSEGRYYDSDRYYSSSSRYGGGYGYSYYPDYVYWSDYYSVLWPVYRGYYDPFYSPGFYYGVTWYPRTYFGLNHYWNSWPYYQAYAPYRYSYDDGYYDHWDRRRGQVGARVANGLSPNVNHPYLYGSARNEAEQLARRTGAAYQTTGAQPGVQFDPFAAQRSSPLARGQLPGRDPVSGQYPERGLQSVDRFGNADAGGPRSRDELRRFEPVERSGGVTNPRSYPSSEQALPSRARTYGRGTPQNLPERNEMGRRSGWTSETPADQEPAAQRTQGLRPSPYYREVGGAQMPVTRQAPAPNYEPTRRMEAPRYQRSERIEREPQFEQAERVRPEAQWSQQEAPQREVFQQQREAPRFEAPPQPRYEAPERSMEMERSRPERDESSSDGSAREEVRRSRDEN